MELLRKDPIAQALKILPLSGEIIGLHAASLTYKYRITLIIRFPEKAIFLWMLEWLWTKILHVNNYDNL